MTVWSICAGMTPVFWNAPLSAAAARSIAVTSLSFPNPGVPEYSAIAVRAPPRITMSRLFMSVGCSAVSPRLVALELRRPLLEERRHPLPHVVRRAERAEGVGLELQPLIDRQVEPAERHVEREAHRERAALQDLVHDLARLRQELRLLEDVVHEADPQRLLRAHGLAGEDQLHRPADAHEPRKALGPSIAGNHAELHLRQPEQRVLRRRPESARARELESAPEAEAVDRGDDRLAEPLDRRRTSRRCARRTASTSAPASASR